MNKLYQQLNGLKQTNTSNHGQTSQILNEAAKKGFQLNIGDFLKFAAMMKDKDVGSIIQELRESGQMSDEVYNSLATKAKGFMNLLNLVRK